MFCTLRTAEFLFRHLNKVSKFGAKTGMHCKNLAIVWAPNLMRSECAHLQHEIIDMCYYVLVQCLTAAAAAVDSKLMEHVIICGNVLIQHNAV